MTKDYAVFIKAEYEEAMFTLLNRPHEAPNATTIWSVLTVPLSSEELLLIKLSFPSEDISIYVITE